MSFQLSGSFGGVLLNISAYCTVRTKKFITYHKMKERKKLSKLAKDLQSIVDAKKRGPCLLYLIEIFGYE